LKDDGDDEKITHDGGVSIMFLGTKVAKGQWWHRVALQRCKETLKDVNKQTIYIYIYINL
jgi:hypothetical protein